MSKASQIINLAVQRLQTITDIYRVGVYPYDLALRGDSPVSAYVGAGPVSNPDCTPGCAIEYDMEINVWLYTCPAEGNQIDDIYDLHEQIIKAMLIDMDFGGLALQITYRGMDNGSVSTGTDVDEYNPGIYAGQHVNRMTFTARIQDWRL